MCAAKANHFAATAAKLQQQCNAQCCCAINASALKLQTERTIPKHLAPAREPNAPSITLPMVLT